MELPNNTLIEKSLSQANTYLSTIQQPDGSFLSFSSPDIHNFIGTRGYHSPFAAALILSCLHNSGNSPSLLDVKQKLVTFLLSQRSQYWSFNYWKRGSPEAKKQPYPDDLDDTFCALSALYTVDQGLLDGQAMAHIIQLLTATEVHEGGPYRTWLVSENAETIWKDVDIAVNSNIAYFLSLQDIELPNLTLFIESAIDQKEFSSPYYPNEYAVLFYLSQFYRGEKKALLKKYLITKRKKDSSWGNPLQTALAVLSLLRWGASPNLLEKSIALLVSQQSNGYWKPYGFCIDPMQGGVTQYSGSAALTTAFCVAAIASYTDLTKKKRAVKENPMKGARDLFYAQVVKKTRQEFLHLQNELKTEALICLEKTISKDMDKQIILLPYYWKQSLGENGGNIPEELLLQLSMASLLGWIAYTAYDNFLDGEGDLRSMSVANFSLRRLTTLFDSVLPDNRGFQELFHSIMNDLDSANSWEIAHCRVTIMDEILYIKDFQVPQFGSKKQLAQKSLGHALGAVAILCSLGYTKKSPEMKHLLSFFINYLIARQLNDDAHDWEDDLRKGQINAVGALLLQKAGITNDIAMNVLVPQMQELFWYNILPSVSQEIIRYTQIARKSLQKISLVQDMRVFEEILVSLEQSAQKALAEQHNAVLFLNTYTTES